MFSVGISIVREGRTNVCDSKPNVRMFSVGIKIPWSYFFEKRDGEANCEVNY
jgi:hypothetical protein